MKNLRDFPEKYANEFLSDRERLVLIRVDSEYACHGVCIQGRGLHTGGGGGGLRWGKGEGFCYSTYFDSFGRTVAKTNIFLVNQY